MIQYINQNCYVLYSVFPRCARVVSSHICHDIIRLHRLICIDIL